MNMEANIINIFYVIYIFNIQYKIGQLHKLRLFIQVSIIQFVYQIIYHIFFFFFKTGHNLLKVSLIKRYIDRIQERLTTPNC